MSSWTDYSMRDTIRAMRRLTPHRVTVLVLFFLIASNAWALEIIMSHHAFPPDAARESIDTLIEQLYQPIGFNLDTQRGIDMLFVSGNSEPGQTEEPSHWVLYEFDDFSQLDADFTTFLLDGFVPVDISGGLNALFVFFVQAEVEVAAWRLTTGPVSEAAMTETITDFREQGFDLHGLSYHDDAMWYLFLRFADQEPARVSVMFTANDVRAVQANIASRVETGWFPTAFTVLPDDRVALAYRQVQIR